MMRLAVLAGLCAALAAPAAAQPRDLTGVWTNSSLTHLTRPAGRPLVVSAAEAERLAKAVSARADAEAAPQAPADKPPPPTRIGAGYNGFWLDGGASLAVVRGEHRTSWLVDPPDGRLPLTPAGEAAIRESDQLSERAPDGPESLAVWDRCLIGSRGSGGPGMLNNLYNNTYQIVQTPGAVVIAVEMIHDARIVPTFPDKAAAQAGHAPAALHPWLGDSTGWWEGPTLVVETINVNPLQGRQGPTPLSPRGRVIERFTRASDKAIDYAFEVDDPVNYTRPWRAELTLTAQQGLSYEFACHEGNYAIQGILSGARAAERAAAQPARADR